MAHYVPLHPCAVEATEPLLRRKKKSELLFPAYAFYQWLRRLREAGRGMRLSRCDGTFRLSDLREFAEQHGDVIGWDSSNRAYVLTHGVSGIDWKHYKHPLPGNVFDVYMKYWKNVRFDS
jgi:hypothetical protein